MADPAWQATGLDVERADGRSRRCLQWPYQAKEKLWRAAGYIPFPAQELFHRSIARFKVLTSGARFGKSRCAAEDVLPEVMTPGTTGWIVGPTYDLAIKEFRFIVEALRNLERIRGDRIIESLSEPAVGRASLRTVFGSLVETRTAENPDSLLGEACDWIICSEASRLKRDTIERYLVPRLATRLGRMIVPTTPFGVNWVLDWFERGQTSRRPHQPGYNWLASYESWSFSNAENPLVPWAEILTARATLHPDVFAEQFMGRFVRPSGLVYQIAPQSHIIDAMPAGWEGWGYWRGIDFGYNNPFCCLWATRDKDSRWYVFDEHYGSHMLLRDHAEKINARWIGRTHHGTAADHDAQDRAELHSYGVSTIAARKDIREGLMTVKNKLVVQPDGHPRLYVHRRCVNTIRELGLYRWPENSDPNKRSEKEEPLDVDNHAMDALRYVLHTFDAQVPGLVGAVSPVEGFDLSGWGSASDADEGNYGGWMR